MKTKIFILLLMMTFALMLCACGGKTSASSTHDAVFTHEIESATGRFVRNTFDTSNYSVQILETSKNLCLVEVTAVCEYDTYIETIVGEIEILYSEDNQTWQHYSRSYRELHREFDFSPLNGTWNAKYVHPSNYLLENDIPYTFTFSNAGVIVEKDGIKSKTTITVDHELNQVWHQYLNPEYIDTVPNGTNYESGEMEITYVESGGYFLIEFEETDIDKMFDSPCQLRIDYRQIIFQDALVAWDCRLSK